MIVVGANLNTSRLASNDNPGSIESYIAAFEARWSKLLEAKRDGDRFDREFAILTNGSRRTEP